ncbi:hypothetical protein JX266_012668 [Neoarthrinium moseri]|nr:hypothetical protein JX266_012668 [Neoarthrinium moseri]
MHLAKSAGSDDYDTVTEFAIVDSSRHPDSTARIQHAESRLRLIFGLGDIHFKSNARRQIWVPPQDEGKPWESGIRCFQLIRQLLFRVTDLFCTQTPFDGDQFFATAISGWINVDFIRHEMIGMLQERCNAVLDYSCRYALEPIQDLRLTAELEGIFPPNSLAPIFEGIPAYEPNTNKTVHTDVDVEDSLGNDDNLYASDSEDNLSEESGDEVANTGAIVDAVQTSGGESEHAAPDDSQDIGEVGGNPVVGITRQNDSPEESTPSAEYSEALKRSATEDDQSERGQTHKRSRVQE